MRLELVLAGILACSSAAAQEQPPAQAESRKELVIPRMDIHTRPWSPEDISERIKYDFEPGAAVTSPNGEKWIGLVGRKDCLVDSTARKVYDITADDRMFESFFVGSITLQVADNGTCVYSLIDRQSEARVYIVADFARGRKTVIRSEVFDEEVWPHGWLLSDDGQRLVLDSGSREYVLDLESQRVIHEIDGNAEAVDSDASVMVYSKARVETQGFIEKRVRHFRDFYWTDFENTIQLESFDSAYDNMFEGSFAVSPSGNFVVFPRRYFFGVNSPQGEPVVPCGYSCRVYSREANEMHYIRYVPGAEREVVVDDEGSVSFVSSLAPPYVLKLEGGKYVWAAEDEPQPEHFEVTKEALND